jgi:S1-C subfamily serine protease
MKIRIAFLAMCALFAPCAALAQADSGAPLEVPLIMDEPGPPLGKDAPHAATNFPADTLRNVGGDLPLAELSRIANEPLSEVPPQGRSAKDAQIYRAASTSVVLVATKDGLGSGTVIGPFGDILTNRHVVRGNGQVGVVFKPVAEGQAPGKDNVLTGLVVKYDEVADLALVKVASAQAGGSFLRLGDASEISVGLDVHAIGHPASRTWSYTKGIISQYRLGYEWQAEDGIKHKADVIQTQTPINPGNSGGPLISDSGTLVGINSFKGDGEGLSFAVSVADVKKFLTCTGNRDAEAKPVAPQKSGSAPAPSAKSDCVPKEVSHWRNKENDATVIGIDMRCAGKIDAVLIKPDDKSQAVLLKVDRNQDGRADVIFFDLKRRDKWDMSWWDENFDGHWTLVGYHDDGSLKPTRFESYEAYKKRMAKR